MSINKHCSLKEVPINASYRLGRSKSVLKASTDQPHKVTRTRSLLRTNRQAAPYDSFIKELNIKLPTPEEKFLEFMYIEPFNRLQNHLDPIEHFLHQIPFFKLHPAMLLRSFAKKVRLIDVTRIEQKHLLILFRGECFYRGKPVASGCIVNRKGLQLSQLAPDTQCQFIAINNSDYVSFVNAYVTGELPQFTDFLNSIQTFKMFNQKTLAKFRDGLVVHFYLKGETLFEPGDEANELFIVMSGKVVRKVIVEIEKKNKIPNQNLSKASSQKYTQILRVISKSYEHKIEFEREDLVGVGQLIDSIQTRKELIQVELDSVLISIDRGNIEENMDEYIRDRLRKYNFKKYPLNYDQLCENYLSQKIEQKKTEQRKISALQSELNQAQSDNRKSKISSIIKIYEANIKIAENKNLLSRRLEEIPFEHG